MSFFKKLFKSEPPLLVEGQEPTGPLPQRVMMKTNLGDIELELYTEQTPKVYDPSSLRSTFDLHGFLK